LWNTSNGILKIHPVVSIASVPAPVRLKVYKGGVLGYQCRSLINLQKYCSVKHYIILLLIIVALSSQKLNSTAGMLLKDKGFAFSSNYFSAV